MYGHLRDVHLTFSRRVWGIGRVCVAGEGMVIKSVNKFEKRTLND